jgi:hypothetical protein
MQRLLQTPAALISTEGIRLKKGTSGFAMHQPHGDFLMEVSMQVVPDL